ncbi:uncharacterized protein LOC133872387 [Alnus glutinosa]|uniref:uncharacterized protein LOC133872387 n=1 Tax=Alnus glutinosa TaxID=3517 RepID=UPI002D78859C|nr:uncharacterized protein LOC133872387 [Alnus glutinosa]
MAQFLLFCMILANVFAVLTVPSAKAQTMAPASSPSSNGENLHNGEAPMVRKLGKHQSKVVVSSYGAPGLSPSEAPETKEKRQSVEEAAGTSSIQTDPIESSNGENGGVQEQGILPRRQHHHSVDKSVAGGGVILGGLATTFLVAVFCYIRATGRRKPETVA